MAERLARIHGTEEDKVNCPFYFKIGACRHGEKCTRFHIRPPVSQTLLLYHMYENPTLAIALASGDDHLIPEEKVAEVRKHFDEFYEDVFLELANYGEIEELHVLNNIGAHLIGNVYCKFTTEEDAENCLKKVGGRFYGGKPITAEYSPVTDFREARCRQFEEGGGHCNFMHLKAVSRKLKTYVFETMYQEHPEFLERHKKKKSGKSDRKRSKEKEGKKKKKHRSRSRSRSRNKSRSGERSKSGSKDKDKDDKHKGMASEERRAMIARWQEDDDGGAAPKEE